MPTPPQRGLRSMGIQLPRLVLGTSLLGNLHRILSFAEKKALLAGWIEACGAHAGDRPVVIDTAGKYGAGLALEVLGEALRELGVAPDRVLIINKLGWSRVPLTQPEPTFEPGAWLGLRHDAVQRIDAAGMRACHEQGCALLGPGYRPQLVALHDPDEYLAAAVSPADRRARFQQVLDALGALLELRAAGEVRGVGVGAKDWRVVREIAAAVELDWVMLANSLTVYRRPPALLSWIASQRERGLGIINAAVFHGGFLVGGSHFDYRAVDAERPEDAALLRWRQEFFAACAAAGLSPAIAALRFSDSVPGVDATAVAVDSPRQARELWRAWDAPLPTEFWERLAPGDPGDGADPGAGSRD